MEKSSLINDYFPAEELFVAIDNLHDGFACISAVKNNDEIIDFVFTYINKTGSDYLKLPQKEIINNTISKLLPQMQHHKLFTLFRQTVLTGQAFIIETPYEEQTVSALIKGYFSIKGTPVNEKIYVTWRDISELKSANEKLVILNNELTIKAENLEKLKDEKLKEIEERKLIEFNLNISKREYETLASNSPDLIRRYDLKFRNLYVNRPSERSGNNLDSLIGKRPDEIASGPVVDLWMEKLSKVSQTGEEIQFHFEIDEDGVSKTYHTRMVPEITEDGSFSSILAISRDITQVKQIQLNIEERKKEFETLAENSTDLIRRFDKNFRHLYVNNFINIFNNKDQSFYIGRTIDECGYEENVAFYWKNKIKQVFETGIELEIEYRYSTAIGEKIFHSTLVPEKDSEGHITSVLSIARDVTRLKSAEEELRSIKEMLTLAVEHFNFMFVIYNPEGRFIYANSYVKEISGIELTKILGRTNEDLLPFSITNKYMPALKKAIKTKSQQALEITINLTGELIHFSVNFLPVLGTEGQLLQVVGIGQDITKQRQIEKELRKSEERFRKAVYEAPIPIIMFNSSGEILVVNKMWTTLSGYTINDIPFVSVWISRAFENGKTAVSEIMEKVYKIEKPEHGGEYELKTKSGETVIWDFYNSPLGKLPDGKRIIISTAIDVTYRKTMEDALYKNELLFRSTFEQAAVGIAHVDLYGNWIKVNQKLCDIVGYTRDELLFAGFHDVSHPGDVNKDNENIQSLLSGSIETYTTEKRLIHRNNYIIWINLTVSLVRDELNNPDYFIFVIQDISDKKNAENDLENTIKALSESNQELQIFANVVSHDLQEPMRMINWFSDFFVKKYRTRLDNTAQGYISMIKNSAERASAMVKDLLNYTKIDKDKNTFSNFSCRDVIRSVISDLSILIRENNAEIIYEDLPEIYGDQVQIRQVFQNLISNAIKFRNSEKPVVNIKADDRGSSWLFSVSDNGIGIEKEYHSQIFTIFTQLHDRDTYPGTGVGLAICKKNVERHSGKIWVESVPGQGSTFYILFPKKKITSMKLTS